MRIKIYFFAGLYFLQGAALAYVVNFQKPFLAGHGVAKETLGLFSSLLLLPFLAKIGFGWISDRYGGRKVYMAGALVVFAACYAALARLNPGAGFVTFAIVTWIGSAALALFDTCADGWAIDVAADDERGPIQAAMIGGKSLGVIVTSFAFGYLASASGYAQIFNALAGLALICLVAVVRMPYRPRGSGEGDGVDEIGGDGIGIFGRVRTPGYGWFALYGILYSVASFGTDGLVTLHLMETRLASSEVIGWYGVTRGLGALLGAYAYVRLAERFGHARTRAYALYLLGLGCLIPLLGVEVGLAGLGWGFCWGAQETAFVTLAMRWSVGRWSATLFAVAMMFSNLGTSLGEVAAAPLVPALGYRTVFLSLAALAWAASWPLIKSRASALR